MKFLHTKELLSNINKISPTKRKNFTFHYLYVINKIRHTQIFDKTKTDQTFINLSIELLRKTISERECSTILENLIDKNIIECDNIRIIGKKSYGYRISQYYLDQKWSYIEVTDTELVKKIDSIQQKHTQEIRSKSNGYQIASYYAKKIEINKRNSLYFIKNDKNNLSDGQISQASLMIDSITNQSFFQTFSKSGRMYTNLNCIKGDLRQFITINGKELHGIDITSSQPVFLGLHMRDNGKNIDPIELEKYLEVTLSGNLYEYLAKEAGMDIDLNDKKKRTEFKQNIFGGCLYDHTRKNLSKWENIFAASFPTILAECREIKIGDHTKLANLLQGMEAKFIFRCLEVIAENVGDIPLTTIHDEIVTTADNIVIVEQIVKSEFSKLGISPKIKTNKL